MGNHSKIESRNGGLRNGGDRQKNAHVIVCGNEKGGSGKTTTAMHVVVALLKSGFKVATIDLDTRQKSFTRYIHNRRNWSRTKQFSTGITYSFSVSRSRRRNSFPGSKRGFLLLHTSCI